MPAKRSKAGKAQAAKPAPSVTRKNVSSGKSKKEIPKKEELVEKKGQRPTRKNKNMKVEEEVSDEETSSSSSENEQIDHELTSSDDPDSDQDNVPPPTLRGKKKDVEQVDASSESDDDDEDEDAEEDDDEQRKGEFFTDENAAWLKPKQKKNITKTAQLMSSSDEEEDDDNDEFEQDKDDEEMLEVEKQSRLLDAEMEAEREEAEEEMRRTIAQNTSIFHLPTAEELEQDGNRVVPPSEIRSRIEAILEVLADFKTRREPGRSRTEYIDQLALDIAEIHGYLPELIEYFLSMFGPSETVEFVDASDRPRPLVIRTNTLKIRRKDLASALMKRGVTLDPLAPWSKVGLKITESPVPVGATPEYLTGMYMLQSAASMCPVMALSPQPCERVLDMSAAPGGKTSYLSQLMRNTGVIIANDLKADRQKATVANMHRLGVRNVITCTHDGRKLGIKFRNNFDRILLDAPCSGLGVISRDPSVKVQRTMADVNKCGHLQKELLLAAIDALNHKSKTGGVMVYSTCSVSVAENEEVINYALSKRDIKLIDTGLDFGTFYCSFLWCVFFPQLSDLCSSCFVD
jgi:ribosomal RNA methyltransferase Nop2